MTFMKVYRINAGDIYKLRLIGLSMIFAILGLGAKSVDVVHVRGALPIPRTVL